VTLIYYSKRVYHGHVDESTKCMEPFIIINSKNSPGRP